MYIFFHSNVYSNLSFWRLSILIHLSIDGLFMTLLRDCHPSWFVVWYTDINLSTNRLTYIFTVTRFRHLLFDQKTPTIHRSSFICTDFSYIRCLKTHFVAAYIHTYIRSKLLLFSPIISKNILLFVPIIIYCVFETTERGVITFINILFRLEKKLYLFK